ncbi:MAG: aldehyde dehydrogenase family protein [Acidimicrobiia bacterium]
MEQPGEARLLIDGALTEAASGARFDNVNPATQEVLGGTADAAAEDMAEAIGAARRAFDETSWSTDRALRRRCLEQLQTALESEREEMRAELIAEVGCPVMITYGAQLDAPLEDGLRWPIRAMDTFEWERELPEGHAFGTHSKRRVVKEPAGVVGAIIPWNFPFEVTLQKVAQALATGNTLIVKPAPDTPWNATRLGRLIAEKTDIPPGVVNVVASSDHLLGEQLVTDPRVDLISFTGSTATGRRIIEKGASTMKRLFLELGGKSADIILDDVDFASRLPYGAAMCTHAGQGCAIPTRMLLPRSRYEEGIEILAGAFGAVPYGDPLDPANLMGPLISERQRSRVLGYIETGTSEGARLVVGGGRPSHLDKGWFVEPTLFADVDNGMTIAREEIFGPVLVVIPFDDDEDAIRIANDNPYGLAANVTSASEERALAIASRLSAGQVGVNGGVAYGADAPFGGYKASGLGRQNGIEGFLQYTETKVVATGIVSS